MVSIRYWIIASDSDGDGDGDMLPRVPSVNMEYRERPLHIMYRDRTSDDGDER